CFFFQAEGGIRGKLVTGVQTCALPISGVTWRSMFSTGTVENMLRQVTPGRYDAYEALLRALATPGSGQVWMLLWHGQAGSPDAQIGRASCRERVELSQGAG